MVTNCSAANLLPAESTQSFTHSCTTYSLIPSDPNTPQSPAATAPLLKRGQPIRCPTAVRKKKNVPPFSPACSFRHADACHLPPRKAHGEKLRCHRRKMCKLSVLKTQILRLFSLRYKEKNTQTKAPSERELSRSD